MSNLTTTGFFWVLLSVMSALLASTGFFLPYWIQGNIYNTTVYLGVFRRCNFLIKRKDGLSVLERACGRYASFHDIPSEAWKASTVMIGLGCGLLLLVALTAISSCCLKDIVTKTSARVGGALQFLAGFLLAIACGIYPSGWGSVEFKQACGNEANFYKLGHCKLAPPSYAECVKGGASINDEGDSGKALGDSTFTPMYPFVNNYQFPSAPPPF